VEAQGRASPERGGKEEEAALFTDILDRDAALLRKCNSEKSHI